MSLPTVSVCIPTYNGEKFIRAAIESVLAQSYEDFELLIVDDASTDQTVEIVKEFDDIRIRLIQNQINVGMVPNWNLCLKHAYGRYLKILCHDDFLAINCLEECVKILNNHSKVSIVFSATNIINTQGMVLMKRRPFINNQKLDGVQIALKSFRYKNIYGEPSNVIFRKSSSEEAGHFDEGLCYAIDWHYWITLSLIGNVYYIDKPLSSFRVSKTSATSSLLKRKKVLIEDDNLFIEKCLELKKLNLQRSDIVLHRISVFFRTYAREIFFLRTRG